MKFRPSDRMLQLGVVPTLTSFVRTEYPEASPSLWQRDAKNAHRRMVAACEETAGDGPFARQTHATVSLAGLLLGFHEAAPEGVEVSGEAFARMVDAALATPIVHMTFAGARPFSEAGIRELEGLLARAPSPGKAGVWSGTLRVEGDEAAGSQVLACTVAHCGLMPLAVQEKRFYLLGHLCKIEAVQAAACGARLERSACLACGAPACELRCTPLRREA